MASDGSTARTSVATFDSKPRPASRSSTARQSIFEAINLYTPPAAPTLAVHRDDTEQRSNVALR